VEQATISSDPAGGTAEGATAATAPHRSSDDSVGGRPDHAVLVVGGRGVRLRPFTTTIPKPLVPIGGELPILEVLLRQLRRDGFDRVTLALGHLGHFIRSYVGDGSRFELEVDYWQESVPLGTVGPLVEHVDELPEHVLVLNGDLLCSLDFRGLMDFHLAHQGEVTLAASSQKVAIEFGVLDLDGDDLQAFREKPQIEYHTNMGIYAIARSALARFEPGAPVGADQLIEEQLANGRSPKVFRFDGYWLDIGRPEDYDRANVEFRRLRSTFLPEVDETFLDLTDDLVPVLALGSSESVQIDGVEIALDPSVPTGTS
jgi:NDP-sugar pyrophosphorylase family protein